MTKHMPSAYTFDLMDHFLDGTFSRSDTYKAMVLDNDYEIGYHCHGPMANLLDHQHRYGYLREHKVVDLFGNKKGSGFRFEVSWEYCPKGATTAIRNIVERMLPKIENDRSVPMVIYNDTSKDKHVLIAGNISLSAPIKYGETFYVNFELKAS